MQPFDRPLDADIERLQISASNSQKQIADLINHHKAKLYSLSSFSVFRTTLSKSVKRESSSRTATDGEKKELASSSSSRRPLAPVDQNVLNDRQLMPPPRLTRANEGTNRQQLLAGRKRSGDHLESSNKRHTKTVKHDSPAPVHDSPLPALDDDTCPPVSPAEVHNELPTPKKLSTGDGDELRKSVIPEPNSTVGIGKNSNSKDAQAARSNSSASRHSVATDEDILEKDNKDSDDDDIDAQTLLEQDESNESNAEGNIVSSDEETPVIKRGGNARKRRQSSSIRSNPGKKLRAPFENRSAESVEETAKEKADNERLTCEDDTDSDLDAGGKDEVSEEVAELIKEVQSVDDQPQEKSEGSAILETKVDEDIGGGLDVRLRNSSNQTQKGGSEAGRTDSVDENGYESTRSTEEIEEFPHGFNGKDGQLQDDATASDESEFKVPKLREKPKPTWTLQEQPSSRTVSFSISKVAQASLNDLKLKQKNMQSSTPSANNARFIVEKSGKVTIREVEALSKVVSDPGGGGRGQAAQGGLYPVRDGERSSRLFNPNANLYSASRKPNGNLPPLSFGSRNPSLVMRTPGARTPVKRLLPSFVMPVSPDRTHIPGVDVDIHRMRSEGVQHSLNVQSLSFDLPLRSESEDAENVDAHIAASQRAEEVNDEFGSMESGQEQAMNPIKEGEHTPASLSPGREAFDKIGNLLKAKDRPAIKANGTLTAPSKLLFSRIDRKPVKSALRRDIENMRAGKSLSMSTKVDPTQFEKPSPAESGGGVTRADSIFNDTASPAAGLRLLPERTTAPRSPPPSILKKPVKNSNGSDSPIQERPASKGSARKSVHFQIDKAPIRKASLSLPECDLPLSSDDDAKSGDSEYSSDDLHDTNNTSQADDNGDPSTLESDKDEGLKNQTSNSSVPGSLSNLVSSVASFIPGASNLFGGRTEEVTPEFEAREAAKRVAQDMERREAELAVRRELHRAARQREAEEKQRRAEKRRRKLAQESQQKEYDRKERAELRLRKRREEEEKQRARKDEEDRKKALHRERVLAQKRQVDAAALQAKRGLVERIGKQKAGGAIDKRAGQANLRPGVLQMPQGSTANGNERWPPQTPQASRAAATEAEITSYSMTGERKREDSESPDKQHARRAKKPIPGWAAKDRLINTLREQEGDPDRVFSRVYSCNLEDVFQGEESKRKRKPRGSSGNWTKDRLTAREEMEYKKRQGFFDNA